MQIYIILLDIILMFFGLVTCDNVPILSLESKRTSDAVKSTPDDNELEFLPFMNLIDQSKDTSEFWRETEIVSLLRDHQKEIDYEACEKTRASALDGPALDIPSRRSLRPICRNRYDFQVCPQCPHFNNKTECELFRESCKERKVLPHEYKTYCDRKYGPWRAMFLPADYSQCRCCDECVFYRELDQSCVEDEYSFDMQETLPVTTIDFRAGCNPYWGHPEQELKALRCDHSLRRCVPVSLPKISNNIVMRRSFRYEPPTDGQECPVSCRGYQCPGGLVPETACRLGTFVPDKEQCNCCGKCSNYQQLNEKCAEFKKIERDVNGSIEIEVEEELLDPGCDDGLVCRQGVCQGIHTVEPLSGRRASPRGAGTAFEPCKQELMIFKKKYGPEGHLHYDAPQCTPLWLYAPVQCRKFVCNCALEDGTIIEGTKVPRVEVSNMNCDCAREKCRTEAKIECDGYGNYRDAAFTREEEWANFKQLLSSQSSTTTPKSEPLDPEIPPQTQYESIEDARRYVPQRGGTVTTTTESDEGFRGTTELGYQG